MKRGRFHEKGSHERGCLEGMGFMKGGMKDQPVV